MMERRPTVLALLLVFAFLALVTMFGDGDKQEYHHCDICEDW